MNTSRHHQPVVKIRLSRSTPDTSNPNDHGPIVVTAASLAPIGVVLRMVQYANEGAEREGQECAVDCIPLTADEMDTLAANWVRYRNGGTAE